MIDNNNKMTNVMSGCGIANQKKKNIKMLIGKSEIKPGIAVVLVSNSHGARAYFSGIKKDCESCGIRYNEYFIEPNQGTAEMVRTIEMLNEDDSVHGILVESPLREGLSSNEVFGAISLDKDIDCLSGCFGMKNRGGESMFYPCTPIAVMELLSHYDVFVESKNCVVVSKSMVVGKPLAMLLLDKNATVTICHSKTVGLKEYCKKADVIISGAGKVGLITKDMVKPGAVIVDVSVNRKDDGGICGDVDYGAVKEMSMFITPVPGGVGQVTRAVLLEHLMKSAKIDLEVNYEEVQL